MGRIMPLTAERRPCFKLRRVVIGKFVSYNGSSNNVSGRILLLMKVKKLFNNGISTEKNRNLS